MYCCYFLNVTIVIVVKIVTAVIAMKPSSSSTGRSAGQKWSQRGAKRGAEKENLVHRAAGSHAEKHSLIILPPRDDLQLDLFSFESLQCLWIVQIKVKQYIQHFTQTSQPALNKQSKLCPIHVSTDWRYGGGAQNNSSSNPFFLIFGDKMGLVGVPLAEEV